MLFEIMSLIFRTLLIRYYQENMKMWLKKEKEAAITYSLLSLILLKFDLFYMLNLTFAKEKDFSLMED